MTETVYLEVGRRRRVHRGALTDGRLLLTAESDNIDAARDHRTVTFDELLAAGRSRACRRCFPQWPPLA